MRVFFALFLFFSLFFPSRQGYSCADGGEYSYQFFFPSSLLSDTSLVRYFPDWTACDDCGQGLQNAIVEEWQAQFPSCKAEDIRTALFEYLHEDYIEQLKSGKNPVSKNSFFEFLVKDHREELIRYLAFILEENKLMTGGGTNWKYSDWEDQTKNNSEGVRLLTLAKENRKLTSDSFLLQRYTFQIVKLHHYLENYRAAVLHFDSVYAKSPTFPQHLTYYRTLGYYAGAQRKLGNVVLAKYLFAKIFDQNKALRYRAYKDFKYIDQKEGEWEKSLALASSNAEKSAMLVAKSIYDFQIDIASLKALYETDSSYARLELALIKQLNSFHYGYYVPTLKQVVQLDTNKLVKQFSIEGEILRRTENLPKYWWERMWYNIAQFFRQLFHMKKEVKTEIWEDKVPEVKYLPFAYSADWIPELVDLLNKIIAEEKAPNPGLYVLAKGYMEVVNGDFEKGKMALATLSKAADPSLRQLSEYLTIWADLLSSAMISEEQENKIIQHLKKYGDPYELKTELGRRYYAEKQYDKAFVVLGLQPEDHYSCAYFSDSDMEKLIKTGNAGFSKTFSGYFGKLDVKALKSTYANRVFLKGKFEEARRIQNDKLSFDADEEATELSYQDLATWDKKGHLEDYQAIATALATSTSMAYNSVPCYNYYPLEYGRPSAYPFNMKGLAESIENRHHYIGKLNYSTDLAESYYHKIVELLKTDEQKAEALVNAQEVAMRDKYALRDRYSKQGGIDKSIYYKELKEKYANTAIVEELNKSCSFLRNERITYY